MKAIVERHGGTVEKFIGDAVMAVFGVPALHEDDALRALRAAVEMRDALPELGLQARIGVMTGEVVTGTEERLATGDAVNVAARLEQAAAPGEVLIGSTDARARRRRSRGRAGRAAGAEGQGRAGPRLPAPAVHEAPERRHEALFVGRERELALLREAWERPCRPSSAASCYGHRRRGRRQVAALRRVLAALDATVVRGRCLPYGVGITYWPVVEVVKQLDALPADPAAAAAIRSLLGESEAGTSSEEIAWAFRKLLEEQAPLVVLFDDIQWGEETFLDLIEHVATALLRRVHLALLHGETRVERAPRRLAGDAAAGAAG